MAKKKKGETEEEFKARAKRELAKAPLPKGFIEKGGKVFRGTKQDVREAEEKIAKTPKAIAQKSIDIEKAKADIRAEGKKEEVVEEAKEVKEVEKPVGAKLDFGGELTVKVTDELGNVSERPLTTEERAGLSAKETQLLETGLVLGAGATPRAVVGVDLVKTGKIGKGKTGDNVVKGNLNSKQTKLIRDDRAITKISRDFGISREAAKNYFNTFEKTSTEKLISGLTNPKTLKWAVTGILAGTFISNWMASDNVISNSGFTAIKIRDAVENNQMSKEEGLEEIQTIREIQKTARTVVNISTIINPFLWSARKSYMDNADIADTNLDIEEERINNFGG